MNEIFIHDPSATRKVFFHWIRELQRFRKGVEETYDVAITLLLASNEIKMLTKSIRTFKRNNMITFDDCARLSRYRPYDHVPAENHVQLMDRVNETASWLTFDGCTEVLPPPPHTSSIYSNGGNFQLMMHWLICVAFTLSIVDTAHLCTMTDVLRRISDTVSQVLTTDMVLHLTGALRDASELHSNCRDVTFEKWFSTVKCGRGLKNRDFSGLTLDGTCKFCTDMETILTSDR